MPRDDGGGEKEEQHESFHEQTGGVVTFAVDQWILKIKLWVAFEVVTRKGYTETMVVVFFRGGLQHSQENVFTEELTETRCGRGGEGSDEWLENVSLSDATLSANAAN